MIQYTPAQIRRYAVVRPDWSKTRQMRSLYPASGQTQGPGPVVIAWDSLGPSDPFIAKPNAGRWCLCYDTQGHYAADDMAMLKRRVYRIFYYWQGAGSSYLEADPAEVAKWLRDHDLWGGDHVGSWDSRMFGRERKEQERLHREQHSETTDALLDIYDRHKDEIRAKFGTFSHYGGKGPNNGSRFHGGVKRPSRLRKWIDSKGDK
jgi:hypothetical protein